MNKMKLHKVIIFVLQGRFLHLSPSRAVTASAGLHGQPQGAVRVQDRELSSVPELSLRLSAPSDKGGRHKRHIQCGGQILLSLGQAGRFKLDLLIDVFINIEPQVVMTKASSWQSRCSRSEMMTISMALSPMRAEVTWSQIALNIPLNDGDTGRHRDRAADSPVVTNTDGSHVNHFDDGRRVTESVSKSRAESIEASPSNHATGKASKEVSNDVDIRHVVVEQVAAEPPTLWPWEKEGNKKLDAVT